MSTGVNPSKTALRIPISSIVQYTKQWNDTELKALWAYLTSLKKTHTW